MRQMAQRWLQIEAQLQAQLDALALELAARQAPVTLGQLTRMNRYRTLQNQVADQLERYASYVESNVTGRQLDAGLQAIEQSSLSIQATAADMGMQIQFDRLPASTVERMVGLAGDGSPLRTVLQSAGRLGADRLGEELIKGVALGLNPREIARRAMRQGLASSYTRMVTIARTEVLRVARQTTQENYQQSNVVRGYRRIAAHSSRTCVACLALDGREYPLTVPFEEHVNGRCAAIPILIRGNPIQFQTGPEWFAQQPESVQRSMMGPARWGMWHSGQITWDDMVRIHEDERWGNSPQVTPVRQLQR